ncbi:MULTISPECIES: hypothetical protein [unclassified Rhizobium]|uniref:hypothetical protein n=1 Tax=unclassified Rhizobium TaxID=2613769 RepID=UPI0009E9BC08|nr:MULTISPECIES: hypothetical protein [unclassified Rhizobium]MBP2463608.1 hypothetical protein [Rhizobium sp. PvP014]MBP2531003.1 hypothetical protein [Rhizobium sp. PvP099]
MSDASSVAWFGMTRVQLIEGLRKLADDLEQSAISKTIPPVRIDQWTVARRVVPCLIGLPTSHPTIADGQPLFSSELYYLDPGRNIARTFSRWYDLGNQAAPNYWEHRYPRSL